MSIHSGWLDDPPPPPSTSTSSPPTPTIVFIPSISRGAASPPSVKKLERETEEPWHGTSLVFHCRRCCCCLALPTHCPPSRTPSIINVPQRDGPAAAAGPVCVGSAALFTEVHSHCGRPGGGRPTGTGRSLSLVSEWCMAAA